jgi:hypothetical protein
MKAPMPPLPETVQLVKRHESAPASGPRKAELLLTTQLIRMLFTAPPASTAIFPVMEQSMSVPFPTPPPVKAELPHTTQLEIHSLTDSHNTPPPQPA